MTLLQVTFVFLTFTLDGTAKDVMVTAEHFRGSGEPPVRGFEYGPISAIKLKDKDTLLEHLDVMVCKLDMPTGDDDDRENAPESTLRPVAPKAVLGDLTAFLTEEEEGGSQRSKGSSKGVSSQPTQDSFRLSQPTQVSPKLGKTKLVDADTEVGNSGPVKQFSGGNISAFFQPTAQVKAKALGPGGKKRDRPVEPVVEVSSDEESSSSSASVASSSSCRPPSACPPPR